jgi:hypothetical protein
MKVRAGSTYRYNPVLMDLIHQCTTAKKGDSVRVVNLPSAPKCNTMGQCHIETLEGKFLGMVSCNSLEPVVKETKQ